MDDQIVVKFKCENCKEYNNIIRWRNIKPNPGKICDKCWNTYRIRMIQIKNYQDVFLTGQLLSNGLFGLYNFKLLARSFNSPNNL